MYLLDACFSIKCFLSFVHTLLVHVFHGHLLFSTSVFCRPCTFLVHVFHEHLLFGKSAFCRPCIYFYLHGEALFGELSLEKKCRTFGVLSFISLLF